MKRSTLILLAILTSFGAHLFAQNLRISGGNNYSLIICGNGNVATWGNGASGQTGEDANGNPIGSVMTPTPIRNLPEIFQVDAGSGAHALALTCDNQIVAWGNNDVCQLGNSTAEGSFTSDPVYVQDASGNNYSGVKFVSGGNNASFAITQNDRVIAWGSNGDNDGDGSSAADSDVGVLGIGNNSTNFTTCTPTFVVDQSGNPIEDIILVEAGDANGYALTANGRIYSWGDTQNNANARTTGDFTSAGLVVDANGDPLEGIVSISAGDRHVLAIDDNGNVWAWGGDWGPGQIGESDNYFTGNYAVRVAGGESGETFLGDDDPIISVAAGQSHSMAVSASGLLYTWGGAEATSNGYSMLGAGCNNSSFGDTGDNTVPVLARTSATQPLTGITDVSDGDYWTFAINDNNEIFVAGISPDGALGTGGIEECYFTELTIPNCVLTTPCPNPEPVSTILCPGEDYTFDGGLIYPGFTAVWTHPDGSTTEIENPYGTDGSAPPMDASLELTNIQDPDVGTYNLVITDDREDTQRPCVPCEDIDIDVSINFFPIPATDPGDLTYCNGKAAVNVNSNHEADNPVYAWFETETSNTELGRTSGSNTDTIDVSGIAGTASGDPITVYVEEIGAASGLVYESSDACDSDFSTGEFLNNNQAQNPNQQQRFEVLETITIDTFSVKLIMDIYAANATLSGTLNLGLYGSALDNNSNPIANDNDLLQNISIDFEATSVAANDEVELILEIPIGLELSPGNYFLSTANIPLTNKTGNGNIQLGTANCTQSVPVLDNLTGDFIRMTGQTQNFQNNQTGQNLKGGHFFDVVFSTPQQYCDRIPVVIEEDCPGPQDTVITVCADDETGTLYEEFELTDLEEFIAGEDDGIDQFEYFLEDIENGGATSSEINNTNLTDIESDIIYVRTTASATNAVGYSTIEFVIIPLPEVEFTIGDGVCEGTENIILTDSVTVDDISEGTLTFAGIDATADGFIESGNEFNPSDATGSPYAVIATYVIDSSQCTMSDTAEVVVNPIPDKPTVTQRDNPYCVDTDVNTIATDLNADLQAGLETGATPKWYIVQSGDTNAITTINTNISTTTAGSYVLAATQSLEGCESDTAEYKVIINPLPEATISGDANICKGDSTPIEVDFTEGTAPFTFTYNGSGTTGDVEDVVTSDDPYSFNVTTAETFTIVEVTDDNGCTNTTFNSSATVEFDDSVEIANLQLLCDPANPTNGAPGTYNFYIEFDLIDGDASTYSVIGLDGTNYTSGVTGSSFTSPMIEESNIVSLVVTDGNGCSPDTLIDLNRVCSCPEVATLSILNDEPARVCAKGDTTERTIVVHVTDDDTFDAATDPDFTFEVHDANGIVGTPFTVSDTGFYNVSVPVGVGVYTIQGFQGSCIGSTQGLSIEPYEQPIATLSIVDDEICTVDDSTDVTIRMTQGFAPIQELVYNDGTSDNSISVDGTDTTFATSTTGTYTIVSVKDGHGCLEDDPSILTSNEQLLGIDPPTSNILEFDGQDVSALDTLSINVNDVSTAFNLEGSAFASGYGATWIVLPTMPGERERTGTITPTDAAIAGITIDADTKEGDTPDGQGTLGISYTVEDDNGTCPEAIDTIVIVNRAQTIPQLKDTTICISNLDHEIVPVVGDVIIDGETTVWTYPAELNGFATETDNGTRLNIATGAPAGTYTITYEITNPVAGAEQDEMILQIDEVSRKPVLASGGSITTCAMSESDVITNAQASDEIQWTDAFPSAGTDNVNSIVGENNATMTANFDANETFVLIASLKNGVCPADTTWLTIKQIGETTQPNISIVTDGGLNADTIQLNSDRNNVSFAIPNGSPDTNITICNEGTYRLIFDNFANLKSPTETVTWNPIQEGPITWDIVDNGNGDEQRLIQISSLGGNLTPAGIRLGSVQLSINPGVAGCDIITNTVTVDLRRAPDEAVIDPNEIDICVGEEITLNVTNDNASAGVERYVWTNSVTGAKSTGISSGPLSFGSAIDSNAGEAITLEAINMCGITPVNVPVEVDALPVPEVDIDGQSSYCIGSEIQLDVIDTADGGTSPTFSWVDNLGNTYTGTPITIPAERVDDNLNSISVTMTSNARCSDYALTDEADATFSINIDVPSLTITDKDLSICSDEPYTYVANANGASDDIYWTYIDADGNSAPGNINTGNSSPTSSVAEPDNTTLFLDEYRLAAIAPVANCPVDFIGDTISIEVVPRPVATIDGILGLCDSDDEGSLSAGGAMSWGNTTYEWYRGAVIPENILDGEDQSQISISRSGPYNVRITNIGKIDPTTECPDVNNEVHNVDNLFVNAQILTESPLINQILGETNIVLEGTDLRGTNYFNSKAYAEKWRNESSYNWSIMTMVDQPETEPVLTPRVDTSFTTVTANDNAFVTYTISVGPCTYVDQTEVIVLKAVKVPEVFSPNGDGLYDFWEIENLDENYPNATVRVFNRWGGIVYENVGAYAGNEWDGTSKNGDRPLPNAVYYYVVELNEENLPPMNGNVTIMR